MVKKWSINHGRPSTWPNFLQAESPPDWITATTRICSLKAFLASFTVKVAFFCYPSHFINQTFFHGPPPRARVHQIFISQPTMPIIFEKMCNYGDETFRTFCEPSSFNFQWFGIFSGRKTLKNLWFHTFPLFLWVWVLQPTMPIIFEKLCNYGDETFRTFSEPSSFKSQISFP